MQREKWESALRTRDVADEAGAATGCTFEFWEHGQSGEVFAVRLGRDQRITGCKGPLFSNQIRSEELSGWRFDSDPRALAWIESHRENWVPATFLY